MAWTRCDLLEKSYLCGVNNNSAGVSCVSERVVICLKNRTFVVSTTTRHHSVTHELALWFAWKIVPLWCQQQLILHLIIHSLSCDLLEKSYLCGVNNNQLLYGQCPQHVVICLKNRTFVVSTTTKQHHQPAETALWFAWKIVPLWCQQQQVENTYHTMPCCDLLEKSYLCGVNNNSEVQQPRKDYVVICLKNRTFVVSTTTPEEDTTPYQVLWFAWKIVPLWCQQQPFINEVLLCRCCDLLEKSYLCGVNNNP